MSYYRIFLTFFCSHSKKRKKNKLRRHSRRSRRTTWKVLKFLSPISSTCKPLKVTMCACENSAAVVAIWRCHVTFRNDTKQMEKSSLKKEQKLQNFRAKRCLVNGEECCPIPVNQHGNVTEKVICDERMKKGCRQSN